jgi:hypothetical protein
MAPPPFAGVVQLTKSWSTCAVADGGAGVAGTVEIKTLPGTDPAEVPAAFVAVTTKEYATAESSPVTTIGDTDPLAVLIDCPDAVAVTVYDVAGGEFCGSSKDTEAWPSLNALSCGKLVATTLMGAKGSKKSFDA